ncbi:MAG: glutamate--cysteine ligase [Bacteriovoracaceae bacterium]|nr:glutamate--cysteine ligase [Bacteriovoracaceae bacterium]
MDKFLNTSIDLLKMPCNRQLFNSINRGVERECLRISSDGKLSLATHPKGLGSSLTNPYITTDFSEALLEFITPVEKSPIVLLETLEDIHQFTYAEMSNEILWPLSMPCNVKSDMTIPIAQYGNSNIGKMKTLYRTGLHHRYGSLMQLISGIHYNYSPPEEFWSVYHDHKKSTKSMMDFKSEIYFSMLRNIHRYGWIILYLFGASPSLAKGFIGSGKITGRDMVEFDKKGTLIAPYGTTLRMSDLGYQNSSQSGMAICYRNIENYIEDMERAIRTPDPEWQKIGVRENGEYKQLNDSILQIENEFYSQVRPKRRIRTGERPSTALKKRGVEYIELRSVDINPFSPVGITHDTINFLDVFLTWCLLKESHKCSHESEIHQQHNQEQIVYNGRNHKTVLIDGEIKKTVGYWGKELLDNMIDVAALLDKANQNVHVESVKNQKECFKNPELTLSGQVVSEMKKNKIGFHEFGIERALQYENYFKKRRMSEEKLNHFKDVALLSHQKQMDIENSDKLCFEEFVKEYYR